MSKEIERKYLVCGSSYRHQAIQKKDMMQGYISLDPDATVRIRIVGDKAFITVKSRNIGAVRNEWEYPVPVEEAKEMLRSCCKSRLIEKTRYIVEAPHNLKWEIDEFHGSLDGLVIAEIELPDEDFEVALPDFIGEDVTGNPRYYNSSLASL
ncbi:MAG: CYTH domain-containing protein [Muribaculaceae bacterium]|nr:CYTH domain-containing protein [Muribaculaceae bacterium]